MQRVFKTLIDREQAAIGRELVERGHDVWTGTMRQALACCEYRDAQRLQVAKSGFCCGRHVYEENASGECVCRATRMPCPERDPEALAKIHRHLDLAGYDLIQADAAFAQQSLSFMEALTHGEE